MKSDIFGLNVIKRRGENKITDTSGNVQLYNEDNEVTVGGVDHKKESIIKIESISTRVTYFLL